MFELLARLDPEFVFGFTGMAEFEEFLGFLGVAVAPHELLFVSTFFQTQSLIRYFRLLQRVFPSKELIESIIVKAVDTYDSFKDFFMAQTNNRDFWKAE